MPPLRYSESTNGAQLAFCIDISTAGGEPINVRASKEQW